MEGAPGRSVSLNWILYLGYMSSVFVTEQSDSLLFAPNIGRKEVKIRINCFPFETNFNPEHWRKTYFP